MRLLTLLLFLALATPALALDNALLNIYLLQGKLAREPR